MSKKPTFNIGAIVSGINEAAKPRQATTVAPAPASLPQKDVVIDQAQPVPEVLRRTVIRQRGRGGKPTSIWLYARDIQKLQSIDLFARQNGLAAGRTVLVRAGIQLLQEHSSTLELIRKVLEDDKRTRSSEAESGGV